MQACLRRGKTSGSLRLGCLSLTLKLLQVGHQAVLRCNIVSQVLPYPCKPCLAAVVSDQTPCWLQNAGSGTVSTCGGVLTKLNRHILLMCCLPDDLQH